MKKLIATLILVLAALVLQSAQASLDWQAAQQAAQRHAMTEWVVENAQVALSLQQATDIVDHTVWQAQQQELEPTLVLAVMRVESGFRASAHGRGSKGLMQVQTYWHRDKLHGRSPFDPFVSIEVGTQILGDCWRKYSGDLRRTLRCYNGGGDPRYARKVNLQQAAVDQYTQQSVFEQIVTRITQAVPD